MQPARKLSGLVASLALCGCATGGSTSQAAGPVDLSERVHKTRPEVAASGELGSRGNPVRVFMPEGEREYLHRLRCRNGGAPTFERQGSAGFGPYGKILDAYQIVCEDGTTLVYMDMYHCEEEDAPLKGFQIVPELGARTKPECR